jgi:hypothetical protein
MENTCVRLSLTKMDDGTYYARYDPALNHDSCTCLNGVQRDVAYKDFFDKTVADFETECRRKATDAVSLATAVKIDYTACLTLQNATSSGKITAYTDACVCGSKQLHYDDDAYRNQPDKLQADCQAAAAGN